MKESRLPNQSVRDARRRASMYIMVLGTSLCVMVIGIGAITLARSERRDAASGQDFVEARSHARSAIEIGLNLILNTTNWRTTFAQGAWRSAQPLGRGTYSLNVVDAVDGNFSNNQDDVLTMNGTGAIGQVQYQLAVSVAPYGPKGMSCLASALHSATALTNNSTITANAPISSNGTLSNSALCTINGSVEAAGLVTNAGTITGTTTSGAAAKEMPAASVFDTYIAQAISIPVGTLPQSGGMREVQRAVLAPTLNAFGGGLNANGVYLINCAGTPIKIQDFRLDGTLILLDPGAGSTISGAILFETHAPAFPVLLVRGNVAFNWTGNLSEAAAGNSNFNPSQVPYQGSSDTDTSDTYPSLMRGLVYVSGNVSVTAGATINGVLVTAGTTFTAGAPLTITHDSEIINAPPAGFEKLNRPMLPVAGTWKQIVN